MGRWLRCSIQKGMFSDERVITIKAGAYFVHKDQVKGSINHQGIVQVEIIQEGGQFWAVLPSEDPAIVEVSSEDLEAVG